MSVRLLAALRAQGTAVENTTTEGSFAGHTFPAGFWQEGKVVEFSGAVKVSSSNSTDTLTPRVRFGASTTPGSNTAVAAGAATDVADDDIGQVRGTITCRESTDDPGSVVLAFEGTITPVDAAPAALGFEAEVSSVNTLAATYLDFTGAWSVANAANVAAAEAFVVREIT